ncbi:unnamed protein product (macronuclear) [Paramecium tetraurelia]|uniref:B30.2/SPRY domain-containing protein n=1 Tax=Paramecium tetraurelia TaxID=5888 RepID=A0BN92_PARTE|nr:uncharacterized protein GSPATT00030647001 [Paramecium tetraurelia]CAK60009.1 unnamed protein product [Paramecium tetraurelia]|eukprot:XP_001427407.1 hypothetical protein (macronuclear) [Paramecium tetraurelia strain d4-2]
MTDSGFECSLCMKLAMSAQICEKCGFMYCKQCLLEIFGHNYECVQCQSKQFKPIEQSALQEAYEEILTKSQIILPPKIDKPPPEPPVVIEKQKLQTFLKENCINFDICKSNINPIFQNEQVCSLECLYFTKIIQLYEQQDFANIRKEIINLEKYQTLKNVQPIPQVGFSQYLNGNSIFTFNRCGPGIQIIQSTVILQEEEYTFKTATSSVGFQNGIHFWKIIPLAMTKNEMKIGVSTSDKYDLKTAFSDYNFGYAFYTVGQFRNGSNSNGFEYGVKFTNTGEVGVLLDMNRGVLAFSYNGNFLGKAIATEALKKGPIYPCVALLHQAGFEFQCGLPAPQNLLDQFLK